MAVAGIALAGLSRLEPKPRNGTSGNQTRTNDAPLLKKLRDEANSLG